jgi:hypothetical protein
VSNDLRTMRVDNNRNWHRLYIWKSCWLIKTCEGKKCGLTNKLGASNWVFRTCWLSAIISAACSFGWWLMAGAGLFWEKSTVVWFLMADLFWEKKYYWLVADKPNELDADFVVIIRTQNGLYNLAVFLWNTQRYGRA